MNNLSAPKKTTFALAAILALVGLIGKFAAIPFVSQYAFFILLAAFVILFLGCLLKGL
jgi:hypothetical protein